MTLAQQLKMFYDGKMASSDAFYFGVTLRCWRSPALMRCPWL